MISMSVYIDKYQYVADDERRHRATELESRMDPNIAAWMIAGGPRLENRHAARDREQLRAFLESQRVTSHEPGILARLAQLVRAGSSRPDPACCPA
jgi:hypothetical protein